MKKRYLIVAFGVGIVLSVATFKPKDQPHASAAPQVQGAPQAQTFAPVTADTPTELSRMQTPVQLTIPSLGITSAIRPVGLEPNNAMALPDSLTESGWYKHGTIPGNPGRAVIAAHTGYPNKPSQFRKLAQLNPKDTFSITDVAGATASFEIIQKATYKPDEAPLDSIFGGSPTPRLALITCAGEWHAASESYSHRLVLFAVRYK